MSKYYAVGIGLQPGVYKTWAECQKQTMGVSGAKFKSFASLKEAENFVQSVAQLSKNNHVSQQQSALRKGKRSMASMSQLVGGSEDVSSELHSKKPLLQQDERSLGGDVTSVVPNATVVYVDGSYKNTCGLAGVGVYFGEGDSRNLAEALPGDVQTNNRAELYAVIRTMQIVPLEQNLIIYSDSTYTIDIMNNTCNPRQNLDLVQVAQSLKALRTGSFSIGKVPAHSGVDGNEAADKLANAGVQVAKRLAQLQKRKANSQTEL